jgi:hypothetical protein
VSIAADDPLRSAGLACSGIRNPQCRRQATFSSGLSRIPQQLQRSALGRLLSVASRSSESAVVSTAAVRIAEANVPSGETSDSRRRRRECPRSLRLSIDADSDSPRSTPYSHSIINERSRLLICSGLGAESRRFTVILTVKPSGISIGAGLRVIRPKVTFRDLSTSIDSRDHRGHHRRAPGLAQGQGLRGLASNAISLCPASDSRRLLYRQAAAKPQFTLVSDRRLYLSGRRS